MKGWRSGTVLLAVLVAGCEGGSAGGERTEGSDAAGYASSAARWIDEEFQPSTLTREQQLAELNWFTAAAAPFRGMRISVVSETLTTHEYESSVLARAFEEITGIQVSHDLIQEGDVIEKLRT
jgi:glycerol transport system substrate-binding protein